MEGSKSFSIDALLAKDTPRKEIVFPGQGGPGPAGHKSPLLRSPGPSSPTDSPKGSYSPGSQGGRGSEGPNTASPTLHSPTQRHGSPREEGSSAQGLPGTHGGPVLPPRSSFIPRPGLLNVHHARHPALAAAAGLFPGHGLYNYPGHPHGGPPGSASHQAAALSMLAGSAFHLPHEQALQTAQMHGVPLEWLARAGMLVHRPPDFAGKKKL